MTSAQSPSKANNLKDNEEPYPSLTELQKPKKANKSSGEDTKVRCPMRRDATHKFWENILPRNQDGHRNTPPPAPKEDGRFSIQFGNQRASGHPGIIRMGAAGRHVRAADGKLRVPLSLKTDGSADQPKPPSGDPGGGDVTDTPPRNSGGTASTRLPGLTHHLLPSHPSPHHTPLRPDSFDGKQRPLRKMSS